ncbi:MAG: hypothetical protein ACM3VS_18150 [Candidatus Dadabacteria bacterium]
MKKALLMLALSLTIGVVATAQTTTETKSKSKPKTTIPQKVHNAVRPHHKHYSGHKKKHKQVISTK